jgi:hypothetical protein
MAERMRFALVEAKVLTYYLRSRNRSLGSLESAWDEVLVRGCQVVVARLVGRDPAKSRWGQC